MAFERLDPINDQDWAWGHADHLARYVWAARLVPGKRVLDAGTGTGYGADLLFRSGAASVQAVDIDAPTIVAAAARFGGPGLSFRVADCEVLDGVDAPLDVICSFENIEHLSKPRAFLAAAARRLGSDGVLVCSTPHKGGITQFGDVRPANEFHVQEWTRDEFRQLVSAFFADVDMHVQVCTTAALARHKAVVALHTYLHRDPVHRISRGVAKLLGRPNPVPDVLPIALVGIDDFPVVREGIASSFGEPMCHVAVCRQPRPG